MAELTRELELEAAATAAGRLFEEALAANASEAILLALIDNMRESRKALENEREREREFLREQARAAAAAAAPPGNPL